MGIKNENCDIEMKIMGVGTVGPKGQIVIPKELRSQLGINPGDSFVFLLKDGKYIGLVRNEDVNDLMEMIKSLQK